MLLLAWILSTSCIFVFTDAGRILVIPPIDSGSHLMLASADHQIHIMDFFGADISKYPAKNFHFINLKVPSPESFNMTEDRRVRWFITYNTHGFQVNYWEGDEVFETLLKMHQSKLEEIMEDDWSLVYADNIFSPHAYAIAMRLKEEKNVPYLMFGPSGQVATHICEELALSKLF
ncbi:hypothetical protein M3Y97_00169600 [Aphelenchoides bicaudatus]|nr:hypothetical protein M3Y97_00169600 [Aphelenchoides bicaudatus]